MDIKIATEKGKCCGCTACASVCPKKCVEMRADSEGFLYPVIDEKKCIHCGKCQRVCPVLQPQKIETEPECYVGHSNDSCVRKQSSSGGIFTELAKQVINNSGVVYGAGFDSDFNVCHQSIAKIEEIKFLQGSKYVQSSIGGVYQEIKEQIQNGKLVYFSGTPCQVAGLYSYLGCRPENLITQDLICHGVGSPMVWHKYLEQYKNIQNVEFRNKKYGWHYFSMHIETGKKHIYKRLDEDIYLKLFLDNLILRPICYDCPIKGNGSQADVTLADCWTPEKISEEIRDFDEGLSLVIANTEKGKSFVEDIRETEGVILKCVDSRKALDSQAARTHSVKRPEQRERLLHEKQIKDLQKVSSGYYTGGMMALKREYTYIKTRIRFALLKLKK